MLQDYTARELSVQAGAEVVLGEVGWRMSLANLAALVEAGHQ
jgi:hypothetical protein